MGRPFVPMTIGERYGKLTISGPHIWDKRTNKYPCRCDCGGYVLRPPSLLRAGRSLSCGCGVADFNRATKRKHGHTSRPSPEYGAWVQMRSRCSNPKHEAYERYAGRGITICDRWSDFLKFLEDMGPRPGRGYSLERVNNLGNYEPGNCKWATTREQNRNKRTIHMYEGRPLIDWARERGLKHDTVRQRFKKGIRGEALFVPPRW